MGQLVSLSSELPPELLSSDLPSSELPPAQPDNDEFPLDPWDEELSELVLDLEATASDQLLQDGSGLPPPSTNLDDATPQQVLGRLLGLMSSPSNRHYERYGAFATKDTDGLIALLMSCLRPEVAPLVELRKTSSVAKYANQFLLSASSF
jgi:hypothetical protein